jgi:hypothetical protein
MFCQCEYNQLLDYMGSWHRSIPVEGHTVNARCGSLLLAWGIYLVGMRAYEVMATHRTLLLFMRGYHL